MKARRHLEVEAEKAGALLTLGDVVAFVERCQEIGIPDDATLSSPSGDLLRRYPITFAVTWTEEL